MKKKLGSKLNKGKKEKSGTMKTLNGHQYFLRKFLISSLMGKFLTNSYKITIIGKEDKKKIGVDCLIYGEYYLI